MYLMNVDHARGLDKKNDLTRLEFCLLSSRFHKKITTYLKQCLTCQKSDQLLKKIEPNTKQNLKLNKAKKNRIHNG